MRILVVNHQVGHAFGGDADSCITVCLPELTVEIGVFVPVLFYKPFEIAPAQFFIVAGKRMGRNVENIFCI